MIEPGNPGSNQGPLDLQSNALPTELLPEVCGIRDSNSGLFGHNEM